MARWSSVAVREDCERYFQRGTALNRVLLEAPYLPRCSDDKTATKIRPREYAIRFPYIQVNRPGMVSWLIFDLDHTNAYVWEDVGLPAPNLIVSNRTEGPGGGEAGRAHLFYAIQPVCTSDRARSKPIEYMKALYLEMAQRLKADLDYAAGPVAKTPGHPWWHTVELHSQVFDLTKLADYVELPPRVPFSRGARTARNHVPHSRACQLFELLRHYAYSTVAKFKATGAYEQFVAVLEGYCLNVMPQAVLAAGSAKGDLPWSAIRSTARSVARFCWDRYRGNGGVNRGVMQLDDSMALAERQRLAAGRTHKQRAANTESRIRAACRALQTQGKPLVQAAVAKAAQLSRQTVAAYKRVLEEIAGVVDVAVPIEHCRSQDHGVKHGVHQVTGALGAVGVFSVFDASSGKPLVGNSLELSIRGAQDALRPEGIRPSEARPPLLSVVAVPNAVAANVSKGRSLDGAVVERLRCIPLSMALDGLGIYWKRDSLFRPVKDPRTERWMVSVEGTVFELLVTGQRWFDPRDAKGGGGAIDLCVHLLNLGFAEAAKRLSKIDD